MSVSGEVEAVGFDQRLLADREEMVERIATALPLDGTLEVLPGVQLNRNGHPTDVGRSVSTPVLCLIAQGTKEWILGGKTWVYDPEHYLIATAELPVGTRVVNASPNLPYLGVVIRLDPAMVGSVMVEAGHLPERGTAPAVDVSPLDARLLDAVMRLLRLADTPTEVGFLAPMITREIIFRLLMGNQGARLRQVAVLGGTSHRIMDAIKRIRQNFDQPLSIEAEAQSLGMSVSTFHAHFKAVTEMSPLEYQKQLRLQEARRLMLGDGFDASSAGYQVGYSDASQFSREYKRLFGEAPMRDIARLRANDPLIPGL